MSQASPKSLVNKGTERVLVVTGEPVARRAPKAGALVPPSGPTSKASAGEFGKAQASGPAFATMPSSF